MRKQKGFSLIELLIVVAIILIIAAIAIPNLLRSRISANEASAVASLRTLNTAQTTYQSTYNSYATNFSYLGPNGSSTASSTAAGLVDAVLGSGTTTTTKSGYTFTLTGATGSYSITALPITANSTGIRSFFTDQNMVIYVDPAGGTPTSANQVLGN